MAEPLAAGADHDTVSCSSRWVSDGAPGVAGFCAVGVALVEPDHVLSPTLLAARARTW